MATDPSANVRAWTSTHWPQLSSSHSARRAGEALPDHGTSWKLIAPYPLASPTSKMSATYGKLFPELVTSWSIRRMKSLPGATVPAAFCSAVAARAGLGRTDALVPFPGRDSRLAGQCCPDVMTGSGPAVPTLGGGVELGVTDGVAV